MPLSWIPISHCRSVKSKVLILDLDAHTSSTPPSRCAPFTFRQDKTDRLTHGWMDAWTDSTDPQNSCRRATNLAINTPLHKNTGDVTACWSRAVWDSHDTDPIWTPDLLNPIQSILTRRFDKTPVICSKRFIKQYLRTNILPWNSHSVFISTPSSMFSKCNESCIWPLHLFS